MSDLILHHYPTSPFAEKVRLILGHKQLAWKSVFIPMIMPKPDLTALTGGYRKTPVLQIGADIYCDTALICDVLEPLAPTPTLYPDAVNGAARIVTQWADTALFTAAMAYNFQPAGVAQVFAGAPAEGVQAFVADRTAMRSGAARMSSTDAKTLCWARSPAWPTLRSTTRCGSPKNARQPWRAFWTRRPKSKAGWPA
jgi:glutathione S-transferase